jgi:hypothetical protein
MDNKFSKMQKKRLNLRNVVKIGVACLTVCMIFTACEKESSDKKITAFSFAAPQAKGEIDEKAKTISVSVPNNTDVIALVPSITVSEKATVSPASGEAQNFTNPITYTVTAEDGSTANYVVTVKKGSGGGLFGKAKFDLPENVSIKYEDTYKSNKTSTLFIRIGNDFYSETDIPGLGVGYVCLKYNGSTWQQWEKFPPYEPTWYVTSTYNLTQVIDKIGGSSDNLLNFMTFEASYVDINGKTKSGTEAVAGVMCDKYVVGSSTYYHNPVFNLFFKVEHTNTLYEVTEWKTNITNFGDIDLP